MIKLTTRIRETRLNKKGETRVLAVLFQGRNIRELSTGIGVKPKDWDQKAKKIKGGNQVLNSQLRRIINDIQDCIDKQTILDPSVSIDDVISKYKGTDNKNPLLVDYLRNFIKINPDNISSTTLMYYNTCLMRLEAFKPKMKVNEVDTNFIGAFEKYLKTEHENSQNTVHNRLKVVRKILNTARREGIINNNPFEYYKIKTETTKRAFLTMDELKLLMDLEDLPRSYELVRDMYVFSAVSGGLRFGDMCTLSTDNIRKVDGNHRLSLRSSKTQGLIDFKLRPMSVDIIKKYSGTGVGNYLFPILPEVLTPTTYRTLISRRNSYFNKVLKLLATKKEISKHLTFHTARHTWATLSLSLGMQTEIVGNIMGHKDLKTTQIYTNILDSRKDEAIDKWDEIL